MRQRSTYSRGIGFSTSWIPFYGRQRKRRTCKTPSNIKGGEWNIMNITIVGQPSYSRGATRSLEIACRTYFRTESGNMYRNFKGHTTCWLSYVGQATNTQPALTTSCGRPMLLVRILAMP
uniref:Set domain protein-like n=1 Tax=Karlodinium veneficum TaxID=407301 RepID=E8Z716_KARVE|nr:set domain protein-like [Karlodinium veneficum]